MQTTNKLFEVSGQKDTYNNRKEYFFIVTRISDRKAYVSEAIFKTLDNAILAGWQAAWCHMFMTETEW